MSDTVLITPAAYAKMLLHALKHPTQPLAGVLIGKGVGPQVFVSDVIPLLHTQVATLPHPITEVGIKLAHSHACAVGCGVVGCYFANVRHDDTSLCELNRRFAQTLAHSSSKSSNNKADDDDSASGKDGGAGAIAASQHVAILLDNTLLCHDDGPTAALCAKLFQATSGQSQSHRSQLRFTTWNRDTGSPDAAVDFDGARARIEALIGRGERSKVLWDLEEHLENCEQRDFLNPWIA